MVRPPPVQVRFLGSGGHCRGSACEHAVDSHERIAYPLGIELRPSLTHTHLLCTEGVPIIITVDEYAPLAQNLSEEGWLPLRLIQDYEVDSSTQEVSEPRLEVD
jgi:hypothetical protein